MYKTGNGAPEKLRHGNLAAYRDAVIRWFLALPPWRTLTCLYFFFGLLRIACAFAATKTPVIMPDSALYLHLSRSIFEKGALLFRGQPIRYEYILYPFFLSPLHLLPESISIFRAAQVYNALLMHLAVFPAYALSRSVTKSHSMGLLAAFLTLLMPDFLITEHIMAESLAFPLILTACLVFYKTYDAPLRFGTSTLWGGLGFLLYALKPGFTALPICFFALLLWEALRTRIMARLWQALGGILAMLGFLGLYTLLLRYGLHLSPVQSTLYGSQIHPLTWDHLLQTFNGLLMYGAFVPLAFGFFPLYLPIAHMGAFEGKERLFIKTVLFSLLALVIGTVYVIYYDELNGGNPFAARVHVRYVSAFLPVLMACLLSPAMAGKRMNTTLAVLLSFSLICFTRWDGYALLSGNSYPVDALLLAAATAQAQGFDGKLLWPMAALLFLLAMAYRLTRHGYGARERRMLCAFLAFTFILSGALAFAVNRHHNDSILPGEAREALAMAGAAGSLGVVQDGACFWPEAAELDVASRCVLPVVELDDLIEHTGPDGSLTGFTPKAYWRENAVNALPVPDKLVLTSDILNAIALTDQALASAASTSNGGYCILTVTPGQPWVHSGLSGLNEGWVQPGSRFTLFDREMRSKGSIILQLQARAGEGQAQLILRCGGQEKTFALSDSLEWISATFAADDPARALAVALSSSGGSVFVQTYLTE